MNFKKIFVLLGLAFASGCSSSYLTPTSRMLSPESEGQNGLSVQAGIHELNRVYITDDISSNPVNTSNHEMNQTVTAGATGSYGLLEPLDVGLMYDIATAPMVYAKFQVLGDSKRTAGAGNFSFSILASAGYDTSFNDRDSDPFYTSSEGVVRRDGHGIYEAGGIFGYRVSEQVLLMAGGSVLWQEISGSQVMTSGATPIYFDDHSRFTEFHFGSTIHFKKNTDRGFFLTPMLQWGWIDSFGNRNYAITGNADFGYQF